MHGGTQRFSELGAVLAGAVKLFLDLQLFRDFSATRGDEHPSAANPSWVPPLEIALCGANWGTTLNSATAFGQENPFSPGSAPGLGFVKDEPEREDCRQRLQRAIQPQNTHAALTPAGPLHKSKTHKQAVRQQGPSNPLYFSGNSDRSERLSLAGRPGPHAGGLVVFVCLCFEIISLGFPLSLSSCLLPFPPLCFVLAKGEGSWWQGLMEKFLNHHRCECFQKCIKELTELKWSNFFGKKSKIAGV
ncbi:hypothetical protein AV530_015380 [Patagioenas fasciata monilis]|uniref:Uncharacterized protein n=1 Tax=Patagioenas fasciata monilis TaxID=372326 RepID=A0A1V4JIG5_PATFA|nr:hypothetical protein AV530_015380 [Patagioenas fasciata monilis]